MPMSMRGAFGGGGSGAVNSTLMSLLLRDPFAQEQYQAELKQWLKDNEADRIAQDAKEFQDHIGPVLEQMRNQPNMNQSQLNALALAQASQGYTPDTEQGWTAMNKVFSDLSNHVGNDAFNTPAALKVAEALRQANPNITMEDAIYLAGKIETPERITAKEQAKANVDINKVAREAEDKDILAKINAIPAAEFGYDQAIKSSNNVLGKIDRINQLLEKNPSATGWGELMKNIPESEQMALRDLLSTIEDNNVIQAMQAIKASSPTGATGMGPITEKEGERLGNQIAKLNQSTSRDEFMQSLKDITNYYEDRRKWAHESWSRDTEWNNRPEIKAKFPDIWREGKAAPVYNSWTRQKMIDELQRRGIKP